MSVPRSDTETRSASFWSFNHCFAFFHSFPPLLADDFTFYSFCCKMQRCVSLFSAAIIIYFFLQGGSLVTSPPSYPPSHPSFSLSISVSTLPAHNNTRKKMGSSPSGADSICTLFTCLIPDLHCVVCVFFFVFVFVCYSAGSDSYRQEFEGWVNAWHKLHPLLLMLHFCVCQDQGVA